MEHIFKCPRCSNRYTRNHSLKRHMILNHPYLLSKYHQDNIVNNGISNYPGNLKLKNKRDKFESEESHFVDSHVKSSISNDESCIKFQHPFTLIVSGPTSSGKTVLTRNVLEDFQSLTTIEKPSLNVVWCYGQWQESYKKKIKNVNIEYIDGLISEEELKKKIPDVIVIDDLMTEVGCDKQMTNLFTKKSHHLKISVIFIVQNLFHQAKEMRTISLNTHYFLFLSNPRGRQQLQVFAQQAFPGDVKRFMEAYNDAIKKPFGYLCVDLKPNCPENLRLRTRLTSAESIKDYPSPIIYTPK